MYKKSAIHYMGNKYALLSQILPLFPKNINNFYDLFGGSGTVSMNVKANKIHLNDLSRHVYNLYDMFKNIPAEEIISYCENMRDKFGFSKNLTDKPKIAEHNYEPYYKFRDYINENPSTIGFYFLTFYSFCNQFRFNNDNFNMPVGNGYFKEESKFLIKQMCEIFSKDNIFVYNKSYDEFGGGQFEENDFVYVDCPYSNTDAVYNSKRELESWNEKSDYKLFSFLEQLNKNNVKWAMSNCFENKGKSNEHLKEWCNKNKWKIHHLSMKYAAHGVDENITDEVLICNYESRNINQLF